MKIQKVEIQGFKSFGRKTVMEFPEGLSCIVGPNGSGKSNVIDAICFALGYPSRNLRAGKASELIHNGAVSTGSARVGITLGVGETLMDVRRKVDRKGRSVYKINSVIAKREDLHEMLTKYSIPKDGYNIVMQNDINRFIEVKPTERRKILDALSGIAAYEEKKEKAVKELEVVERRISDTNLILSEKKSYLDEIGKDREVALKYQDMQDEYKKKKALVVYCTLRTLEEESTDIEKKIAELSKEKDGKIVELARIEEQLDEITSTLEGITSKILNSTAGEQGKLKGEMGGLRSGIEKKQEEIQFLKEEIDGLEKKRNEIEENKTLLLEAAKGKKTDLAALRAEVKSMEQRLAGKEQERDRLMEQYNNSKFVELENERRKISAEAFEIKNSISLMGKELDVIGKREAEIKDIIESKEKDLKALNASLAELEKNQGKLDVTVGKELAKRDNALERKEKLAAELAEVESRLSELFQNFAKAEGEMKAIQRMEEKLGESQALTFVKNSNVGGFLGRVIELGSADDKYKTALEVAAGNKGNCLVVKDDKVAQKYIEGLRDKKIGRATFLPLNKISGPKLPELPKSKGIIGWAKDLIKCDKKFQAVFDMVFGDALVVEDLETARRIGIGKQKMVTLEGDFVNRGGAMTGGFYQKSAISFSSTEETKKKLDAIRKEIAGLQDKKSGIQSELSKLEKDLQASGAGDKGGRIELEVLKERANNTRERINALTASVEERKQELKELAGEKSEFAKKKGDAEGKIKVLEAQEKKIAKELDVEAFRELNSSLQDMDEELKQLKEQKFEVQTRENSLKSEIEGSKLKAADLDVSIEEISASIKKFQKKIEGNIDDITKAGENLKALEEKHMSVSEESSKLFKEQELLNQRVKELGSNKGLLEAVVEKTKNAINDLNIRAAKIETKLEEVKETAAEFEEPKKKEMEAAEPELKEMGDRVKKLERGLEAVGAVNLRAVELFDELEKQYHDIKEKNEKLHIEKEKIYDLINTIEEKKKTVFFDSFYKVKDEFEEIISEIYPTTEGRLLLENESDPFNSGLILEVKPRGREGMNLDSLSGGEKVLTTIAFMMATQIVNKSPFYILDEIDAPLDQENVVRLVQFLRARKDSQFIMISHNPETVKHMDAVIGVHMQKGVSKIVGVDMLMVEN